MFHGIDVVPMGHLYQTAHFCRVVRWQSGTLPLDHCASTFKLWRHMLGDDFETLLSRPRAAGEQHPYNHMFDGCAMFFRDGKNGWADAKTHERVSRLRSIMARGQVVGLAFYFEEGGGHRTHATRDEIIADAYDLVTSDLGFCHIMIVWFSQQTAYPPKHSWRGPRDGVSVLQYTPISSYSLDAGSFLGYADIWFIENCLRKRLSDLFVTPTL